TDTCVTYVTQLSGKEMIRKKIYREHFLSEICPKKEKATKNQWLLSGWQDCFSPTTPNSSLKLLWIDHGSNLPRTKKARLLSSFFVGVAGFEPLSYSTFTFLILI